MKNLIIALSLLSSMTAFAADPILDCRMIRMIDSTYFEEGLSVFEYPDLDISSVNGRLEAGIGGSSYSADDGDTVILTLNSEKEIVVQVTTIHGDLITLTVERRRTMAKATLKVKETDKKSRTIGYAVCQKGIL